MTPCRSAMTSTGSMYGLWGKDGTQTKIQCLVVGLLSMIQLSQILKGGRCEGVVHMKTRVEGWCVWALNTFLGFYIIHKRSAKRGLCIKTPTRKQLPSLRRTLKDQ